MYRYTVGGWVETQFSYYLGEPYGGKVSRALALTYNSRTSVYLLQPYGSIPIKTSEQDTKYTWREYKDYEVHGDKIHMIPNKDDQEFRGYKCISPLLEQDVLNTYPEGWSIHLRSKNNTSGVIKVESSINNHGFKIKKYYQVIAQEAQKMGESFRRETTVIFYAIPLQVKPAVSK